MALSTTERGSERGVPARHNRYTFYANPENVRVVTEAPGFLELELINKPKKWYNNDAELLKDNLEVSRGKPKPKQHVIFVGYKSANDFFEQNREQVQTAEISTLNENLIPNKSEIEFEEAA